MAIHSSIRHANRLLHLQGPEFQGNMPHNLRVSLMESCNLRCYMCHLSTLPEELRNTLHKEPMSADLFERLADDCFHCIDRITFGFAGEPTLHPEFGEFLRMAHERGVEVEVWTNGTQLHKAVIAHALADYADWLVVSLDGATYETFKQIRGGAALQNIERSLGRIYELAQPRAETHPLKLAAHSTLMRSTIAQLPLTVEKAHELNMVRVSASHIGIFDGNLQEESLFLYKDEADRYLREAAETAQRLGIQVDLPPLFACSDNAQPVSHFSCGVLYDSLIVLSNGDVLPCCHAASRFRLVMGNLNHASLPDIWYGYRYGNLRDAITSQDLTPACRDCASNNPFMNVSDEWELDEYSTRAEEYREDQNAIQSIHSLEVHWLQEQYRRHEVIRQQMNGLYKRLEDVKKLEAQLRRSHPLLSYMNRDKFFLAGAFQKQAEMLEQEYRRLPADVPTQRMSRHLNRRLFEQGPEFQGNYPIHLEVSIIAGCNIECIMCTIAKLSEGEQKELRNRQMDRDTYQRLVEQVFPFAESIFFGIGGEPTLHPLFPEFVRQAALAGLQVNMTTNGLTLSANGIADTCVQYIAKLIVSMDGACKETFERIRKGADWDTLLSGIQKLIQRRRESPGSPLQLAVNFTLMRSNIEEFPEMVSLAHELGIEKVMAEHLIATVPELQDESLFLDPQRSDRYMLKAIERARDLGMELEIPDLFNMDSAPEDVNPGTIRNVRPQEPMKNMPYCRLLGYSVVVMPDGQVQPCSHPDAQHQLGMGQLTNHSFADIWFGLGFQTLRAGTHPLTESICGNCSMSGRSDGEVPVQQYERDAQRGHNGHGRKIYPKPYLPRRIRFLQTVWDEKERLQSYIGAQDELLQCLTRHEKNLWEIVERKRKKKGIMQKPLAAELAWGRQPPRSLPQGANFTFQVRVRNTGSEPWSDGNSEEHRSVMIGGEFLIRNERVDYLQGWGGLPCKLYPNEEALVTVTSVVGSLPKGHYTLRVDAVKLGKGFFAEWGTQPLSFEMEVDEPRTSESLWARSATQCTNSWTPTQGVARGPEGTYPLFLTQADKAHVTDLEGRRYLDYIMGWGTATLGYNHPRIREAVAEYLGLGPTLPLPHPLQVEAAEKLRRHLPNAERVLFGKNGSDVLEAAVRIARRHTRRDLIFCCGYHGFHDWFLGSLPSIEGIPQAVRSLVHPFPYGDLQVLRDLLDRFRGQVAAIVMEPASLAYPPEGYLQTIREWTRQEDIVLVFDEIMSAFRLANGGAQEVYGVQPDLAAVGKGIANGHPLAALAGPRTLMDHSFTIGYGPTFQGEVYSLAAANAALDIYQCHPICERINTIGQALRDGIIQRADHHGIGIDLLGILPRQVFQFHAAGGYASSQIRTYFLQELLHQGILCGGTLLPSFAHTDEDVQYTLTAIERIFDTLSAHIKKQKLLENIHIPLHTLYLGEEA